MSSKVRVYMGCSIDGFVAGNGNDISFLERAQMDQKGNMPTPEKNGPGVDYGSFIADIGAMLMGRNTYNVVNDFDGPWPYHDLPVFVATSRPLSSSHPEVKAIKGNIQKLIERTKQAANGKDVYIDGGNLIRQALDADLVDELIITMVPILLGEGISLFSGLQKEHLLEFVEVHRWNQRCIQWIAKPRKSLPTTN